MSYTLILGDYAYSSWSLRGWLLFAKFGIKTKSVLLDFASNTSVADQLAAYAPAKTVPTVVMPDGAIVSESLAIVEELASRHPDAGLWPSAPSDRATARSMTTEMHSGFAALRGDCPMNLRIAFANTSPSEAVLADVARLETLWAHAHATRQEGGPWLFGTYSAADAFFAPVAARLAGYDLPMSDLAKTYVATHLADRSFRQWRAMGLVQGETLTRYAKPFDVVDWPGPRPLKAHAVSGTDAENDRCPYSGKAVTDVLEFNGRRFGFCNPICRDKTVADPEAWPAFMALVNA
ncbi:glutathione S-transferase [Shimia thalassica]|uniref:glutathione S-transferase n=1 Tax=Shimia thalassica TaxID=1715693 RepID=UPI0027334F52|nr:glutathione S-transferase [Shimia thalassica]MDP2493171.1 glutathione S-transferase [Shimia thalassica]